VDEGRPTTDIRVGFVGLGMQGAPMARRVIDGGFPTTLWARRAETLEPFADATCEIVDTLPEVGARSDVVCICVFGDEDVEEVLTGDKGILAGMRDRSVVAVHSTVSPHTCQALAATAHAHGVSVIDAPVSGSAPAAAAGRLLVMVGGSDADYERARPVLATFGDPVIHVGPLGSGQLAKLVHNVVLSANMSVVADALAMGEALGLAPELLIDVLRHGTASSRALDYFRDSRSVTANAGRAKPLLGKDADLAFSAAREARAPTGILEVVVEHLWALMEGSGT
jgi:3-hydroxyisobutyrate dehydrogenase-like beta-hydroxyacid dehydrogenase